MNDLIGYHASCSDRLLPFVKDRSGSGGIIRCRWRPVRLLAANCGQLRSRIEAHLAAIHRSRRYTTMHSDKQPWVIAD
jgi:hypothetical protein